MHEDMTYEKLKGIRLLNSHQVAEILGVHHVTIRGWAISGKLPCVTLPNGQRKFRIETIASILINPDTKEERGLEAPTSPVAYKWKSSQGMSKPRGSTMPKEEERAD